MPKIGGKVPTRRPKQHQMAGTTCESKKANIHRIQVIRIETHLKKLELHMLPQPSQLLPRKETHPRYAIWWQKPKFLGCGIVKGTFIAAIRVVGVHHLKDHGYEARHELATCHVNVATYPGHSPTFQCIFLDRRPTCQLQSTGGSWALSKYYVK